MLKQNTAYKKVWLVTSMLIVIGTLSAQRVVTLSDGQFIYRLTVEQLAGAHYRHIAGNADSSKRKRHPAQLGITVGTVKSITIFSVRDTIHKQVIIPAKNESSWPWTEDNKGEKFISEDINFDGNNDIRLLNSADNFTYYYWIYQRATRLFIQDTVLNNFINPQFDQRQRLVYVNFDGATNKGIRTYKYIDSKLTLIEEEETKDDSKKTTITIKKLVNGKMEVVNTVESIDKSAPAK